MMEQEGLMIQPSPKVILPTISLCPRFKVLAPPFFMLYNIFNQISLSRICLRRAIIIASANIIIANLLFKVNGRMIQHIKKLFLLIIALTCFTCFQRADYNLPLFAFSYFLWDYSHPYVRIFPLSLKKQGCSISICPLGWSTLSGSSTGESPGVPVSTKALANLVVPLLCSLYLSLLLSLRYVMAYSARSHHYLVFDGAIMQARN